MKMEELVKVITDFIPYMDNNNSDDNILLM